MQRAKVGEIISIHAAREGGDLMPIRTKILQRISIHAAREGGDAVRYESVKIKNISIHAAREGGDICTVYNPLRKKYFNPRRP